MRSMVSFRILWCNQGPIRKRPSPRHAAGMTSHGLRRILATELGWPRCCWFSSPADNRTSGTAKNLGGKVEEGFGRVTGDAKTKAQGQMKQAEGSIQDLYGQAVDATEETRYERCPLPSMTRYGTTSKISRSRLLPSPWVSAGSSEGRTAPSNSWVYPCGSLRSLSRITIQ